MLQCMLIATLQAQPLTANAGTAQAICIGSQAQLGGSPTATGGTATYHYLWSPSASLSNDTVANPSATPTVTTTYTLTVTDASSNTATDNITITVNPLPFIDAGPSQTICLGCCTTLMATGGTTYQWVSGPGTSNYTVCPTTTTNYMVFGTLNGCTASNSVTVNVNPSPVVDAGNNQTICVGSSATLTATGGDAYQWAEGPASSVYIVSPTTTTIYTVSVYQNASSATDAVTVNVVNCQDTITGKVFFDNNNNGTQDNGELNANNIMVNVQPDNMYSFTDVNGNFKFPVPLGSHTVSVTPTGYFTVTPSTQTANFTSNGQTDSLGSFALYLLPGVKDLSVDLSGNTAPIPGFGCYFYITYKNKGTIAMNGSIDLIFDNHYTYSSTGTPYTSMTNDTIVWNFTNLLPQTYNTIQVGLQLPSTVSLGTLLTSKVKIYPVVGDTIPTDNADSLLATVVGGYDPNEKLVEPAEPLTTTEVANAAPLTYTIRFQNTGTASAVNISVVDTLDQNLNISSFEMIAASHPYTLQISGAGILKWNFTNIMLPDSNTNEPASHGFIKYSVRPKTTLTNTDTIKNRADIYFDFNTPVVTNTVSSYLEETVSTGEEMQNNNLVKVYPNPTDNNLTLETPALSTIEIFDIEGQLIKTIATSGAKTNVDVSVLPCGVYVVEVRTEKGIAVKKFIKE